MPERIRRSINPWAAVAAYAARWWLPLGAVACQRMLQGCLPEKLQPQGTGSFHVLPGNLAGRVAVLLFDGLDQGFVLVKGLRPAVSCRQRGPWRMDEVGGQAVQQVLQNTIVGGTPDGRVELEVCGDSGLVIRILELPVPVKKGLKPHEVRELAGPGRLPGSFLFEKYPHVIDLDDLLRVNLGNLQPPGYSLKEALLLEAGQRLPDGGPGDAEALGK